VTETAAPASPPRSPAASPLPLQPNRLAILAEVAGFVAVALLPRYALRAPLRSPLPEPRSCATKLPGSNPSWGKLGVTSGHVNLN
jgi:hypothetical protein